MRRYWPLLILWWVSYLPGTLSAAKIDATVTIVERSPRDFGFVLGDTLTQRLHLTLPAGQSLNLNALPSQGRMNDWLDLRTVAYQAVNAQEYTLDFTYQLFRPVRAPSTLTIPETTVLLVSGDTLALPAWPVGYAPMLVAGTGQEAPLRTATAPVPEATQPLLTRLFWLLAGMLVCGLGWLWLSGHLPFGQQRFGSFTRSYRLLKRQQRQQRQLPAGLDSQQALSVFRNALADSAGQTLFPDQLNAYFASHAHYAPLHTQTEALLTQAHQAAFASTQPIPELPTAAEVVELCGQFSQREQAAWTR